MLFTNLPDKIFEPFASKNRELYEQSLLILFNVFYSTTRDAPTREEVVSVIHEILLSKPEMWQSEGEDETETDVRKLQNGRARDICDRLTECGWLELHKSGYRAILEFSPAALHLMQSLWKINNGSVERLEGVMQTLRSILNNLKNGNVGLTSALTQCVGHLADIRISMRNTRTKMMRTRSEVFKIRGQSERFAHLMNWYVGGVFIQDVGHIMSDRHPWKLRRQTISVIEEFLNDDSKMLQIGMEYARDNFYKEMTEGTATERLDSQDKGRQMAFDGFNAIKDELSAIDEIAKSITTLQSKLNDLLAIQGTARIAHGSSNFEKLETVMSKFAVFIGRNKFDIEEPLPAIVAEKTLHLSEAVLRTPNIRRKPTATALPAEPEDPVALFRQQLNAIYQDRIHASDHRVFDFIEKMIGKNGSFSFDENSLSTIDDFIAASSVVKMAISGEIPPNIENYYEISCDDAFDLVVTEYMACPKITIRKLQENRRAA